MKLSLLATVSAFTTTDQRHARDVEEKGEKRYFQLADMMGHYNPSFDEKKYWTYGCHCLILGDRPMSDMGHGRPVDALDTVCKAYKECQKCARAKHGDMCIGEFVKYKYGEKNGDKFCKDKEGSCGRDLCMCDLAFAKAHVSAKSVFKNDYHMFWSTLPGGWSQGNCQTGTGSADMQCCQAQADDTAWVLYNANNKVCCADGSIGNLGDQC
jgi:hypothetical protein